ncbi:hypothetical protein [Nocardiopsis alba]|uniref:hypothetical protein n=1 Tax=Nocardiopsis alba TaxID=53437 RepID=UPI003D73D1A8
MSGVRTITRGGTRFYVSPEDGRVKYPGVTSIVGMVPKTFLTYWAAKTTAEAAIANLEAIRAIAANDPEGAVDYLKNAPRRYTKARADVGSMAHDVFERIMNGEIVGRVHPDIQRHVNNFAEFKAMVNPELISAENVAWSDTHQYAGSYDAILRVWIDPETGAVTPDRSGEPHVLMVDYKTSKSTYPDVALQLSAYAHADHIIDADGAVHTMPEFDGAAVLHITETAWAFKPVRADRVVFSHFLDLRRTFEWDRELSRTVLGKPLVKGGKMETGTERRAR